MKFLGGIEVMLIAAILSVIVLILIPGCGKEDGRTLNERVEYRNVIPSAKRAEAAAWITKTVAAANPHSDEEPEDNIA